MGQHVGDQTTDIDDATRHTHSKGHTAARHHSTLTKQTNTNKKTRHVPHLPRRPPPSKTRARISERSVGGGDVCMRRRVFACACVCARVCMHFGFLHALVGCGVYYTEICNSVCCECRPYTACLHEHTRTRTQVLSTRACRPQLAGKATIISWAPSLKFFNFVHEPLVDLSSVYRYMINLITYLLPFLPVMAKTGMHTCTLHIPKNFRLEHAFANHYCYYR